MFLNKLNICSEIHVRYYSAPFVEWVTASMMIALLMVAAITFETSVKFYETIQQHTKRQVIILIKSHFKTKMKVDISSNLIF